MFSFPAVTTNNEQPDIATILRHGRHDYFAMETDELIEARDRYVKILDNPKVPHGIRTKIAEDHDHILDALEARQDLGDPLLN